MVLCVVCVVTLLMLFCMCVACCVWVDEHGMFYMWSVTCMLCWGVCDVVFVCSVVVCVTACVLWCVCCVLCLGPCGWCAVCAECH